MDFLKPRSHRMNRRRRIYEGKAKVLYEGPEPGTLIQYFKDDATAFNAKKHEVIEGKGVLNNRISEFVFQRLNDIGVPTHFIRQLNMREQLIREVEIIPLEVVVRNVAAGSLSTRLGLEEGTQLPRSIIEFYYKNDQLNDPMVSEEHITAFGWAAPQEIDDIMALAIRVNDFLSGLFLGVGIRLVDFKIETGPLVGGRDDADRARRRDQPQFVPPLGRQDQRQDGQGPLPQGSWAAWSRPIPRSREGLASCRRTSIRAPSARGWSNSALSVGGRASAPALRSLPGNHEEQALRASLKEAVMSDSVTAERPAAACVRLRAGEPFVGKQGFTYAAAISAETAGASAIHMQLLTVPPGARAKAHKHEAHETALYVLSGEVGMYYGEKLENHMVTRAGDFVYIPANTPHLPYNLSQTAPATAVVSRTDPNEQESVVMLPELDAIRL